MATELLELQLEELSLVDRPANAEAIVTLFKRDDPNKEEIVEMTEKSEEQNEVVLEDVEAIKSDLERLKSENESLRKGILDEGYTIDAEGISKKAPEEFVEYEGQKINKADIPGPILKALEEAELEKADVALTKQAEEKLPHFSVEAAKGLISAVSKMDDMDEIDMLFEALAAADKAFADKMEEFGKSDVNGDFAEPSDKMENLVKSYMEENNLTKRDYQVAYSAVAKTDEGKALIKEIYKKD